MGEVLVILFIMSAGLLGYASDAGWLDEEPGEPY